MSEKKELNQEELKKVSGGSGNDRNPAYLCPHCGSDDFIYDHYHYGAHRKTCNECGTIWDFDNNGNITNIILPEQYEDPKKAMENILKLKADLDKRLRGK